MVEMLGIDLRDFDRIEYDHNNYGKVTYLSYDNRAISIESEYGNMHSRNLDSLWEENIISIKRENGEEVYTKPLFTKGDLRTGYIVRFRNGNKCIVMLDTEFGDMLVDETGCNGILSDYDDEFRACFNRKFDIVEVLKPHHAHHMNLNTNDSEFEVLYCESN